MRSFRRDWRRWSRAERLVAVTIAAISLLGFPLTITMTIH